MHISSRIILKTFRNWILEWITLIRIGSVFTETLYINYNVPLQLLLIYQSIYNQMHQQNIAGDSKQIYYALSRVDYTSFHRQRINRADSNIFENSTTVVCSLSQRPPVRALSAHVYGTKYCAPTILGYIVKVIRECDTRYLYRLSCIAHLRVFRRSRFPYSFYLFFNNLHSRTHTPAVSDWRLRNTSLAKSNVHSLLSTTWRCAEPGASYSDCKACDVVQ